MTGAVPGFVTRMDWGGDEVPATIEPKTKLGGVSVRVVAAEGAGGLARANPKGEANEILDATVSVVVWISSISFELVLATYAVVPSSDTITD